MKTLQKALLLFYFFTTPPIKNWSLLLLMGGAINGSIGQNTNILKIYEYASERGASELDFFSHFHILKLLFPSIFCWYFWYFISETYIFSKTDKMITLHLSRLPSQY